MTTVRPPSKASDDEASDSDVDSNSSISSDNTSRTTPVDSWYDVKSDTEQRQRTNQSDRVRTDSGRELNGRDASLSPNSISGKELADTGSSVSDRDGFSSPASPVFQETQEWVNPYWSTDSKAKTHETYDEAALPP